MPTDTPTGEREMAREALGLLRAHATGGWIKTASGLRLPDNAALCFFRAKHIHERYGSCPGFWGEVLAAVRVLAGDPHLHIERDRWGYSRVATFTSAGKRDYLTHGMAGEPAAILAALRAVVGADHG